ncbi:SET domain-containing protein [Dothidotthia symphoricarpi CBS 119687]|uniref:SET domain-containing protein n=1 Tax=Dothidotthia symphoricarpi CBS 119687 TaxID=1392245 RepID=A0A6A6A7F8_9PLEO|nr:SET domain-containing protein [Dothidotthia symphoricarpi CBS 119687]KAF2126718.1 SET domain-containing protein [Dothidotthia symphoricarpi CBS 119687]
MTSADKSIKAPENDYYEVRAVPGKGYGCFALKRLALGTRILAEDPLLIVPIADYVQSDIQAAFDILSPEQQALYFTLHSGHGQDPRAWPSQIHPTVTGRERQRISEQHDARTGKQPSLISIFQTNCMEMGKGAAVFPHAARFNHSCNPNACFSWNSAIGKETIHTISEIKAGDQITLSYCDMVHDKRLRSWELKHYGFVCDCPACAGDEDDEDTFAYKSAQRRFRLQELDREVRFLRGPNLEQGAKQPDFVAKLLQLAAIHLEEGDNTVRLASVFLDIALVCEFNSDFKMAGAAAARACEIKKLSQGTDFPDYKRYVEVVQRVEAKLATMKT